MPNEYSNSEASKYGKNAAISGSTTIKRAPRSVGGLRRRKFWVEPEKAAQIEKMDEELSEFRSKFGFADE